MENLEEKKDKAGNSFNSISSKWALPFSVALILVGLFILGKIYAPLLREEIRYVFSHEKEKVIVLDGVDIPEKNNVEKIIPVDTDFSLVIPKISANSKVVADVDSTDEGIYQRALTKGVAHALGTSYPGEEGNVFIFAHSGVDFAEAVRYNAVFYLLGKMEKGDEVKVFYKGKEIGYTVREKKVIDASESQYMEGKKDEKILTLMTCWPAGTTFKRLIVIADQN